jgi:hypothetical protein
MAAMYGSAESEMVRESKSRWLCFVENMSLDPSELFSAMDSMKETIIGWPKIWPFYSLFASCIPPSLSCDAKAGLGPGLQRRTRPPSFRFRGVRGIRWQIAC